MAMLWPEYSRTAIQKSIKNGEVRLDGIVCCRSSQPVVAGQRLQAVFSQPPPSNDCAPEALALDIVYEDNSLLVINKPAGLVCHPGHGNRQGTLQAGLLHHFALAKELPRGGLVHRLDKDTSGLLVAAKTPQAQRRLIAQFKQRTIRRIYLALVQGTPPPTGRVDLPIGRHRHQPTKMAVRTNGKPAVTRFVVEKQWRNFAFLRCFLETGRTHQIRVHLAHKGYPIVGDRLYAAGRKVPATIPDIARQALHAVCLQLLHPSNGELCEWECPPPADMTAAMRQLEQRQD